MINPRLCTVQAPPKPDPPITDHKNSAPLGITPPSRQRPPPNRLDARLVWGTWWRSWTPAPDPWSWSKCRRRSNHFWDENNRSSWVAQRTLPDGHKTRQPTFTFALAMSTYTKSPALSKANLQSRWPWLHGRHPEQSDQSSASQQRKSVRGARAISDRSRRMLNMGVNVGGWWRGLRLWKTCWIRRKSPP